MPRRPRTSTVCSTPPLLAPTSVIGVANRPTHSSMASTTSSSTPSTSPTSCARNRQRRRSPVPVRSSRGSVRACARSRPATTRWPAASPVLPSTSRTATLSTSAERSPENGISPAMARSRSLPRLPIKAVTSARSKSRIRRPGVADRAVGLRLSGRSDAFSNRRGPLNQSSTERSSASGREQLEDVSARPPVFGHHRPLPAKPFRGSARWAIYTVGRTCIPVGWPSRS